MTPRGDYPTYQFDAFIGADEIIVDSFAGGGGASLGIQWALGRGPHIAINHDKEAIALHAANHPESEHFPEDVWHVDPVEACRGRKVGLMWLSPDCKHFSKAKGGKPVSKKIRGLAWTAVRWAKAVRPRVIVLENVEEFQTWGPVSRETNRPDPARKGLTFKRFIGRLRRLGYQVEWKELRACDYGAPTIRKRLFLIARCDGRPIVWPQPTHGKNRPQPWRTAAECIDWAIPCPSIFERKKALADNTLRRIARGIDRYVLKAPKPFIVQYHSAKRPGDDRIASIDAPLGTQTIENRFGLVAPVLAGVGGRAGQSPERSLEQPYQTITAKGDAALVSPVIVPLTHTRDQHRGQSAATPLATITGAHRGEQALIAPTLVHFKSGAPGAVTAPAPTQTSRDCFGLVAPTLIQTGYGERQGQAPRSLDIDAPLGTVVGGGVKHALVAAFMAQHNTDVVGHAMTEPVSTIVQKGCTQALVSSSLVSLRGTDDSQLTGRSIEEPLPTISGGGIHAAEVRAFLCAYYGNEKDGGALTDPMRTVTSKERFGLVTVEGVEYAIADIGMRMLAPRELYRAQGFPDSYQIDIPFTNEKTGKTAPLTKTAQVRMCGNSVCPPLAAAIISANLLGETFAGRELVA